MASQVAEIQTLLFVVFTGLMGACFLSVALRAIDLRRHGQAIPLLLYRDVGVFGLLAVPFAAILFARASGIGHTLIGNLPWALATGGPAIAALITFLLFEVFVVGKRR